MRVVVLKEFAKTHFPCTPLLDYAIEVEKITTSKVSIDLHTSAGLGKLTVLMLLLVYRSLT